MAKEKYRLTTDGYDIFPVAFKDREEAISYAKQVDACGHHPHLFIKTINDTFLEIYPNKD